MKPLTNYTQKALNDLTFAEKQAAAGKQVVPMVEEIFDSGWPDGWLYRLSYSPGYIWIEFVKTGELPTDQEVRELKKSIMRYTTTVRREFSENTGRFRWMGKFDKDSFTIEFELYVDSDPNCEIRAVEKMVTVFESVCDDKEPTPNAQNTV